jgi:serine/threonine protein kinase
MADVAVPRDPFALTGSTLAGRYQIECQIGEGGFAVVYRAYQTALDRFVALKVLKTPPALDAAARATFREKFASEARTIARLKHPYVVSVYDFGVDRMGSGELAPWMALEWLDGETLQTDLDRRRGAGGRSTAEAVSLLRPVIDALAYAHRQGIVHRDVKPANMMLVPTENGRVLRILDFGIAKIVGAEQADTAKRTGTSGTFAFSPDYAAPEQVTFSRTGPWTDVHALGLVLTEMLSDEPPFSTDGDGHLFEQVMAPSRPTPRRRGKQIGPLEKVIEKAVALSPRQRWQNAGELLRAIDSVPLVRVPRRPAIQKSGGDGERPDVARTPSVSWSRTTVDRLVGAIGGTAVVIALGTVGWTLGAERPSLSPSAEFALARSLGHTARAHAVSHDRPLPWIVSISPAQIKSDLRQVGRPTGRKGEGEGHSHPCQRPLGRSLR